MNVNVLPSSRFDNRAFPLRVGDILVIRIEFVRDRPRLLPRENEPSVRALASVSALMIGKIAAH